jgi:outer membrane beta-barrel protein
MPQRRGTLTNQMRTTIVAIASLIVSLPAFAQEIPGIDLSQPPPPQHDQQPPAEQPPPDEGELPPVDLSRPQGESRPPPPPAPGAAKEEEKKPVLPFSDKDVALGDKVKAVQRKGFLKRGRFEIAPMFATTVNDAFYQKFGGGLRVAYSLQDSFALALRGNYFTPYRTDNARVGKLAMQSQLLSSQLNAQVMLDGVWSPVYGKAAFLGKSIVHFDLYLAAGVGAVWSATSVAPRNEGPHIATDLGGGVRFYPKEWLAFDLGLMATLYPDQPVQSVPGTVQKVFVANVGFSFFFPTTFEYFYP